jgi:hypothetical protein
MIAALILASSVCYEKDMLESYLKDRHELRLHSWGLNDTGNMLELWLNAQGHWAVVTTTPDRCSTVEFPHKLRGRLWAAPSPNKAIPQEYLLNPGDSL